MMTTRTRAKITEHPVSFPDLSVPSAKTKWVNGAAVILLAGCMTEIVVPADEAVSLEIYNLTRVGPNIDSNTEAAVNTIALGTSGALVGASAGMGAGALIGASCGPLVFICAPVYAIAGGVIGGVAGGLNAASLAEEGINGEKARRFNETIFDELQTEPFLLEIEAQFLAAAGSQWTIDQASASKLVLKVNSIGFKVDDNEAIDLEISSELQMLVGNSREVIEDVFSGNAYSIDDWLESGAVLLNQELNNAAATIAQDHVLLVAARTL